MPGGIHSGALPKPSARVMMGRQHSQVFFNLVPAPTPLSLSPHLPLSPLGAIQGELPDSGRRQGRSHKTKGGSFWTRSCSPAWNQWLQPHNAHSRTKILADRSAARHLIILPVVQLIQLRSLALKEALRLWKKGGARGAQLFGRRLAFIRRPLKLELVNLVPLLGVLPQPTTNKSPQ